MASITKYTAKRARAGYLWRVQYRDPSGRGRTKSGFTKKAEAEAWAAENTLHLETGSWIDPNAGNATLSTLTPAWFAGHTSHSPSYCKTLESTWRIHVEPAWGHRKIASIRRSEVQAWVGTIRKHRAGAVDEGTAREVLDAPASPTTVMNAHAVLAQLLDLAVGDNLIRSNPARGVKLPKKPPAVKVYLTAEQLNRLVKACGDKGDLIALLGTSGIRYGEAIALRVKDVNVLRRRLTIARTMTEDDDEESTVVFSAPKSKTARTVAVTHSIIGLLEERMEGKAPDELLWARANGEPLRHLGHTSFFHGAVRRLHAADESFPELTPHGLRHVAAGLMVASGASVKVVQKQLGHKSAAMTLDRYADLFDGDLDEVADRMDQGLSGMSWNCREIG